MYSRVIDIDALHLQVADILWYSISKGAGGGEAMFIADDLPELQQNK